MKQKFLLFYTLDGAYVEYFYWAKEAGWPCDLFGHCYVIFSPVTVPQNRREDELVQFLKELIYDA